MLLRVRWQLVAIYLIGDLALDLTIFRLFGIYTSGQPMKWWVMTGVNIGVWSHALVLAILLVAFVRAPVRWERAADDDGAPPRDYPTAVATGHRPPTSAAVAAVRQSPHVEHTSGRVVVETTVRADAHEIPSRMVDLPDHQYAQAEHRDETEHDRTGEPLLG